MEANFIILVPLARLATGLFGRTFVAATMASEACLTISSVVARRTTSSYLNSNFISLYHLIINLNFFRWPKLSTVNTSRAAQSRTEYAEEKKIET